MKTDTLQKIEIFNLVKTLILKAASNVEFNPAQELFT